MKLWFEPPEYVAIPDSRADDMLARQAGFTWSSRRKCWYTASATVASRLHQFATGALAERLRPIVEAAALSSASSADVEVPAPSGLSYLPFQKAGIAAMLRRPKTLLADEMGLGKSIETLGLINACPDIRRVVVVCPASLKLNWQREARRWLLQPFRLRLLDPQDHVDVVADGDFLIVNYDILGRFPALQFADLDLLVVDECHALKNPSTIRSKAVAGIHARREVFLTGTPIPNRVSEIFPVASRLAGWPREVEGRFKARFCKWDKLRWDELSGPQRRIQTELRDHAMAELQDALRKTIMVRRLKDQVLTELPPKFRQIIELDPGSARAIVRNEVEFFDQQQRKEADLRAELEAARLRNETEYKAAVARLRDTVFAGAAELARLRHATALAKVPHVIDRLRAMLEEGQKVVVFAHHVDVIHQLADAFKGQAVRLLGETTQTERQWAVDRFQTSDAVRLFVGSIYAAGEGITLTAARTAVFAESDWTPSKLTQAEDRLHRIGQRGSVLIQHLAFDQSLDARMLKMAVEKQALADAALNQKTA